MYMYMHITVHMLNSINTIYIGVHTQHIMHMCDTCNHVCKCIKTHVVVVTFLFSLQPAEAKDDFFASFSESPPPSQPPQAQAQQAQAKDVDLLGGAKEDTQPAAAVS